MNDYYTLTGLLTQGGAIVGTTLVTATVGKLGGDKVTPYLKFVAVALALMFAFLFAMLGQAEATSPWAVALLTLVNGAIVFLSAMGGNEVMTTATRGSVVDLTPEAPVQKTEVHAADYRDPASPPAPVVKTKFFQSWF
jgi:hypothetical protein